MLQRAGACFFAVAAHGPKRTPTEVQLEAGLREHPERREAESEIPIDDVHAALDVIAQLTQMAYNGNYDDQYETLVKSGVQAVNTRVEASVVWVEGVKK